MPRNNHFVLFLRDRGQADPRYNGIKRTLVRVSSSGKRTMAFRIRNEARGRRRVSLLVGVPPEQTEGVMRNLRGGESKGSSLWVIAKDIPAK